MLHIEILQFKKFKHIKINNFKKQNQYINLSQLKLAH
jgi:hypothetical protein